MLKELLDSVVTPDGKLDENRLVSSQVQYTGRNGKQVVRFILETETGNCSFIFKPLTNSDTLGREAWLYRNLLPSIPIRYPKLLAYSETDNPEHYWAIYEDLGELQHRADPKTLVDAARAIPLWHNLPGDSLPASFRGHSPLINEVIKLLQASKDIGEVCSANHLPDRLIFSLLRRLSPSTEHLFAAKIVSHGDYYPANFTMRGHELIVLDWEYMHCNSVYWDLFNLIDLTSPRYRKPPIGEPLRYQILESYYQANPSFSFSTLTDFQAGYRHYAALYSLWVLLLIERDLSAGRFERNSLLAQRDETLQVLRECSSILS